LKLQNSPAYLWFWRGIENDTGKREYKGFVYLKHTIMNSMIANKVI